MREPPVRRGRSISCQRKANGVAHVFGEQEPSRLVGAEEGEHGEA